MSVYRIKPSQADQSLKKRSDPRLLRGVESILKDRVNWNQCNVYYWYYATQVCHHMENVVIIDGKPEKRNYWKSWNDVMRQTLCEKQSTNGDDAGSWDPTPDQWGDAGGRLYVTCLCTYMLEVYYRHLPIYRRLDASAM